MVFSLLSKVHARGGSQEADYLVKSPFGVSQEGDAVSLPDADGHSSETGG